jgi:hypothetical protein
MEGSELGGQWNVPRLGGQWKGPRFGGQWKVPKLGGQWKGRKKHLFTSSHSPPNDFIETFNFSL